MKQAITLGIFIVVAAVIIGVGVWYNNRTTEQSQQAAVAEGNAVEAAAQQQAAQQQQEMSELKITDLVVGTGTVAEKGDTVSVLYTGTLDNGTVFDASSKHGNQPFSFTLGVGQVIEGWDLGVVGMKVGGTRELTIPPDLAYGSSSAGNGVIPANSTLHFTVQLLSVSSTSGQ